MDYFKETLAWLLVIGVILFMLIVPVITYAAGQSDGFNAGYQKCLVDFKHKDK